MGGFTKETDHYNQRRNIAMSTWTFMIEQLTNGSWIIGWRQGNGDYDRLVADRAGFATYEEAEKFAVAKLKSLLRKQRDDWAKKAKDSAISKALAAS